MPCALWHADQQITGGYLFLGQITDQQPDGYQLASVPIGLPDGLDTSTGDVPACHAVFADDLEIVPDMHRALLDETYDSGSATGDREDLIDYEAN